MIDKVLTIPSIIKKIDQQLVNQYAIAANDPNPIHTDPNIAQHTIFKNIIFYKWFECFLVFINYCGSNKR